ncbi:MAG: PAS domain-containing protein [Candidatus Eisenbacteria bacterium]|nr:PAS domain-containing protein [Candidatus Eisenbacteria bacterium]
MHPPTPESGPPNPPASPAKPGAGKFDVLVLGAAFPRLLDAISDAVVVVDALGNTVAANRRFLETFGFEGHALDGRPCPLSGSCITSSGPTPHTACIACEIATTKQPRRALQVVPDATGRQRRWEATLNPVLDELGNVSLVVEVWRDVTDRTQLEAQLSHSERLASLGLLAAGVAHEVNNPLASVLAGVESLQRWLGRVSLPPEEHADASEVLSLLEQETRRCRETTDKLLLLGQPYATKPVWVDLNRAARDTLALLSFATRRQRILVRAELTDDLPSLWGREGAIRGVLMNLCMNAVQAMANGGQLTVRTLRLGEDRVLLEVEDDGPGIAPDHLNRIWDPFFTTKPVGQGTGLGLSITQRIVSSHGGRIRVVSEPGKGARFTVTLPTQGSGGESV